MKLMRIEYKCKKDGSITRSTRPSNALLYWVGSYRPHKYPVNPEPFKVYIVGAPMPSDTSQVFLTLLYATTEREFNITPPFEIVKPDEDDECGGTVYQELCLKILYWLEKSGFINDLIVENDREDTVDDLKRMFPNIWP